MKKILSVLMSFVLITSAFAGCRADEAENTSNSANNTDAVLSAVYPVDITVIQHTNKQKAYLDKPLSMFLLYANGLKEKSRPDAVEFRWNFNDDSIGDKEYLLKLSENEDMQNAVEYTSSSESVSVYNLKLDTTYYWTVEIGDDVSSIASFTTDGTPPRNLYVDGITNVRDLGGWECENGGRTKQGMIFRCGRLNESSAETVNIEITDFGKRTMLEELGIKSEIDVRKTYDGETGAIISSPLGDSVTYYSCPMEWEGNTFNDNKEELLSVFEILSKEENYPLIFHCNIGTDRTGMIAFLVNALLGVPEESLFRDYLFSNFGNIGGTRHLDLIKKSGYYSAVQDAKGNSLSEKTYNCLVDFGVPSEQLDSIIKILSD